MIDPKLWYLKKINLFADLEPEQLEYVSSCFNNKSFKASSEIPGIDTGDTIFLLKSGVIELFSISEDGKKTIIDILGPGSIFGNLPHDRDFILEAKVKKECMICRMDTHEFFKVISKYPGVSEKLLKALYAHSTRQKQWISALATESVPKRLLRILKTISSEVFQKQEVHFTHEDLANMVGTSRQTVTTLLNTLKKEGRVKKQGTQYLLIG